MKRIATAMIGLVALAAPLGAQAMVEIKETKVDSVTAWYAEDDALPVVHMVLTFTGAGVASDPASKEGRATMVANLLTEGAGDMDALAFHKALESKAIQIGVNATRDDLVVSIHTLKKELPEAMRLTKLALLSPRFDAQSVATAHEEQLSSLRSTLESPGALAARAWNAKLYGTHPYANDGIGSEESIARLDAPAMEAYRARYLTRANLQISAAGAIDKSELKDALDGLVSALPAEFKPERDMPGANMDGGGQVMRVTHAGPQSVVVFGGPSITRADKRYYAYYLMNAAFGGGELSSRLMRDVRVKQGLVYYIGTALSNGDAADSFVGQFATRNETVDAAIAGVKQSAKELADHGLTPNECADVKREVIGSFALRLDSTAHIAEVIAMMMRFELPRDYLEKREHLLGDVTCDDIQQAAKQLLQPEHWLFTVVGGVPKDDAKAAPVTQGEPQAAPAEVPESGAGGIR